MDVKGKKVVVTGGAGFIGSHAVEALVAAGAKVTVIDDLSAGKREWLAAVERGIVFAKGDAGDPDLLDRLLPGTDSVWHLAANPEVRTGETDPSGHYEQNVAATFRLLEAMRRNGVRHLVFTSTSTVYGRASVLPTPEAYGPLLPISVYGACKLACEALIAAYAGTFGFDALLFRFANVVGPRSTHGVTYDFVAKLRKDPKTLEVLGDGRQTKSYVSVADTVAGMLHGVRHAPPGAQPFNVGSLDAIAVTELAGIVAAAVGAKPRLRFAGGAKDGAGWVGDVKAMALDVTRLRQLGPGWKPRHSSADAIRIAAEALVGAKPVKAATAKPAAKPAKAAKKGRPTRRTK
ncbi:MAG: UDP-glucose 4-epimerase [Thermoplasmata archaeon]|nr:UDP-glucose 4-epimerase [Thermoplasmata archaeon]